MIERCPPALLLVIGSLLIPCFKGRLKQIYLLALPLYALYVIYTIPEGAYWTCHFMDRVLTLGYVDRLSRVFGIIFALIAFLAVLFAMQEKNAHHMSALVYSGSALGVTFAGDFFTLYVFWEMMAVASTFLILAGHTIAARKAAFRYVLIHLFGGLLLLAGIAARFHETGTLQVGYIGLKGISSYLIFLGVALNAAVPPLHPWLKDAYPEATPSGTVFLSAFTTKSAVYVMARTFPGAELLIWLGAIMTVFPILYAVFENNLRRVLSYSLINQVGFMLCGVGIGTQLALNGTASHAFCHILYKALLFMSMGSVLQMTGKIRCTDLGGLYKTMPLTCLFCMVGAASISAFPLFSGFISKSMILSAAGHHKMVAVWFILQFASAGVLHHAGLKVPFYAFFAHDSGIRTKEPPLNMLVAMGITAFFCIFLGVYPEPLYRLLPYPVDYVPYTASHVVGQLQLLMFFALGFALLLLSGYHPPEIRAIHLDVDWLYRIGGKRFYEIMDVSWNGLNRGCERLFVKGLAARAGRFSQHGLARLTVLLAALFWLLSGYDKEKADRKREAIFLLYRKSAFPIGLSAAAATALLVLIFSLK